MPPDVVHVLPDTLGGVHALCHRLLAYRPVDALRQRVVLTHSRWSRDPRPRQPLPADRIDHVEHCLPAENLYAALRRMRPLLAGEGALVANDLLELAAVAACPPARAVFQILHGDIDYYYDLACRHDADVDVFITLSESMHRRLIARLPHRADTILHLRSGVPIGPQRAPAAGPLRLLFSGRIERTQKGVFDLPAMAARLEADGVQVVWTIQGDGPDREALRQAWNDPRVCWTGPRSMTEAVAELPRHDVFVMPSRWEGLPQTLLEAAAAGLVPVASDISGIRDVVRHDDTGFCCPADDPPAFAAAIARLAADRPLLERMGAAARADVAAHWNMDASAAAYHHEFGRWREWRERAARARPARATGRPPYGSRLDRPWLPNPLVKAVRRLTWRRPA